MQKIRKAVKKTNFQHFRHDNSADIQYLKVKLSGEEITALLLEMKLNK